MAYTLEDALKEMGANRDRVEHSEVAIEAQDRRQLLRWFLIEFQTRLPKIKEKLRDVYRL